MSITIGVDIDEVLAHYLDGLRHHINTKFELNLSDTELDEKFPLDVSYGFDEWDIIQGNRDKFIEVHAQAVKEGIYANLTMVADAKKYVNKLKADGHHIRIITSRFVQKWQNSIVMKDTSNWLDEQGIKYDDIVFTEKKTDIRADIYIDDSPKNILAFQECNANYIIFDMGYNRNLEGTRVHSWAEAYEMLTAFAESKALEENAQLAVM